MIGNLHSKRGEPSSYEMLSFKRYLWLLVVCLAVGLSYAGEPSTILTPLAKRPLGGLGPDEPYEVGYKIAAMQSMYLGIGLGFILTLFLAFKGSHWRELLKSFILAPLFCSLPGLGYLLSYHLTYYVHYPHYAIPDYIVTFYPSALSLGICGGFIRGLYAYRQGLSQQKTVLSGIIYCALITGVVIAAYHLWVDGYVPWSIKEHLQGVRYYHIALALGILVGLPHGIHLFHQTSKLKKSIIEGVGVCCLVMIAIFGAFYAQVIEPSPILTEPSWYVPSYWFKIMERVVPTCAILVFLFMLALYLKLLPFSSKKRSELGS